MRTIRIVYVAFLLSTNWAAHGQQASNTRQRPYAFIDGSRDGHIRKGILADAKGPQCTVGEGDERYTITGYTISLYRAGNPGEILFVHTINSKKDVQFDAATKEALGHLHLKDKVVIENIKVLGPDKITRILSPLTLIIDD